MNAEVKEKWVEALRSGEYRQGEGRLKEDDRYCCLGVLCDLYRKGHDQVDWRYHGGMGSGLLGEFVVLPSEVVSWSGLPERNPTIKDPEIRSQIKHGVPTLSTWNDSGATFEEIADYIERCL